MKAESADYDVADQDECENSIGDFNGIRQEYSPAEYTNLDEYVKTYNNTTDKTKLIILETHRFNNNGDDSLNADIQFNGFIIEEECSIGFVPGNNDNSIDNEPDVVNTAIVGDNKYCVICNRSDDTNPLPLPPESAP